MPNDPTQTDGTSGTKVPINLKIEPPLLVPLMTPKARKEYIVLLDIEMDAEEDGTLRVDLDVAFNPRPLRRKLIGRADYYVGCTGAEISLLAAQGVIKEYTRDKTLDVNYSNTEEVFRKRTFSLNPGASAKSGGSQATITLGPLAHEAGSKREFAASFKNAERLLATVVLHNEIKWTLSMPRGTKAVRDFLIGNLYLFAKCAWDGSPKQGTVSVRPSDISFFDQHKRALGRTKSLVMQFLLWENFMKVHKDGYSVDFSETTS